MAPHQLCRVNSTSSTRSFEPGWSQQLLDSGMVKSSQDASRRCRRSTSLSRSVNRWTASSPSSSPSQDQDDTYGDFQELPPNLQRGITVQASKQKHCHKLQKSKDDLAATASRRDGLAACYVTADALLSTHGDVKTRRTTTTTTSVLRLINVSGNSNASKHTHLLQQWKRWRRRTAVLHSRAITLIIESRTI